MLPHITLVNLVDERKNLSLAQVPPLVRGMFDIDNEDSEKFGVDGSDFGKVESPDQLDFFTLGADSRAVQRQGFDDGAIQVPMYYIRDVEYAASVFIGTPVGQRAKVVFDSGSNWLTVKSCLT